MAPWNEASSIPFQNNFFRGLPKTTKEDQFCTLRMKIRGKIFPSGSLSAFLSPHWKKKSVYTSRWLEGTMTGVCGGPGGHHQRPAAPVLPAKEHKRNVLFVLLLWGSGLCNTLLYGYFIKQRRHFTPKTKEGCIPSKSFPA